MGNAAHQHLLVNHFPIIGAFLAVPLLLLTIWLRKERGLLLASVFLLVVTALTAWGSVATGEEAMGMFDANDEAKWFKPYEEAEKALGDHEEWAERSLWAAVPTALLGIGVLILAHRRPPEDPLPRAWIVPLIVGAGATAGIMGYTGKIGGLIMHREIRGDSMDTTPYFKDGGGHAK